MIDLLKNKLIQNASQFRYMYFGIILTILVFLLYKFIVDIIKIIKGKENKKEKIINILKNKYLIGIIITIIPILLEVFLYGNYKISFSKDTYITENSSYHKFLDTVGPVQRVQQCRQCEEKSI